MKSSFSLNLVAASFLAIVTIGCSSTTPKVDLSDARRVLGRDNDVRVDAQLTASASGSSTILYLVCEIENLRDKPIVLAADSHSISIDSSNNTLTVALGSEIPEAQMRLTRIAAGEKKSFTTAVSIKNVPQFRAQQQSRLLRVKVNFLGAEVAPFEQLNNGPKTYSVSNDLFPMWLENNQSVVTNAVPMEIETVRSGMTIDASRRSLSGTY
jgi:hypothetical protein